ncbi:hypothetical protein BDV95DRAFT_17334 [Massariosphaeria phaeospora]|uniref:Uncharacterized protein n=1 Tax=Massariosphaeria phaeospora TaxID=100035 RepID=A0A7C8MKA5_9PLEO|nr:hypothetical protein BDV95DRAFT_17334 [Massariosphaeria phaeospora]
MLGSLGRQRPRSAMCVEHTTWRLWGRFGKRVDASAGVGVESLRNRLRSRRDALHYVWLHPDDCRGAASRRRPAATFAQQQQHRQGKAKEQGPCSLTFPLTTWMLARGGRKATISFVQRSTKGTTPRWPDHRAPARKTKYSVHRPLIAMRLQLPPNRSDVLTHYLLGCTCPQHRPCTQPLSSPAALESPISHLETLPAPYQTPAKSTNRI